jgi:hypothetical protein
MSDVQQEKPADAWGQPISEERQAELAAMLAAWDAPGAEHGEHKGPFDRHPGEDYGVRLAGGDVFWLAEQSGRDEHFWIPNLHLEGADLNNTHLETLRHMESFG